MKKLFFAMAAMAAMLTSCSKDDGITEVTPQNSMVTFTVNAPELATRANEGQGLQAKNLKWVIYDLSEAEGKNQISGETTFPDDQLQTNVEVSLVEGRKYEAIFFAYADNSPYTFDATAQTMSINTSGLTANNEAYDAFFKYVEPFEIETEAYNVDVKMKRPFAQLNVATNDRNTDAGKMIDAATTGIKVQAYKSLNLKSGDVLGEKETITYDLATDILGGNITVEGRDYDWLTMNYILVNDRELVTVEFMFTDVMGDGNMQTYTRTYNEVPVQRNYKTNIVGSILTSTTNFNVEILPGFETPEHNYFESDVWDGSYPSTPTVQAKDEDGNPIYVDDKGNKVSENTQGALPLVQVGSAADFAGLVGISTSASGSFVSWNPMAVTRSGESTPIYIQLTSSIDLAGHNWTPIAFNDNEDVGAAVPFEGVFDGNGYTISNLKIHKVNRGGLGLFGAVSGKSTFKNITLDNVDILSDDTHNAHRSGAEGDNNYLSGGQIGALVGYNTDGAELTFENVHIKGLIKIEGEETYAQGQRVAGVFGGKGSLKSISFDNVSVKGDAGSYIKGFCSVGGVAGQLQGPATFEKIQTDIEVRANTFGAGGVVGIAQHTSSFDNCSVAGDIYRTATEDDPNKALSANSIFRIGGIVGCWSDGLNKNITLDNCSFTGKLYSNANTSKPIPAGAVTEGFISKFDYNGLVGRGYTLTSDGTAAVIIDGTNYYYVRNAGGMSKALATTAANNVIQLINTVSEDAVVEQEAGVNIVIDGAYNTYTGAIRIDGKNRGTGAETVKIENVKFYTDTTDEEFTFVYNTKDGNSYPHNITIDNCTFEASAYNEKVGSINFVQAYHITVKNSSAKNLHSLAQFQSIDNDVTVDNVKAVNCKNGISFGNTAYPTLKNSEIETNVYGVRGDGNASRGNLVIENTTINAEKPVIIRKVTTAGYSVVMDDNTTLATTAARHPYHVVFTAGDDDADYVAPTVDWSITGAQEYNVYPGPVSVATADELVAALESKFSVSFTDDIKINPANMSNAYGKTGINVMNGQNIYGNGYTLDVKGAGGTWDSGICTSGGIIKDITVTGSFRGIFVKKGTNNSKVYLDNVTVSGTTYTISVDSASKQGLEATNSTFKGWTSYAATLGDAKFVNCSFGEGSGYAFCRPYAPTVFENCKFEEGYTVDPKAAVTFKNCTLNGVAITAENVATLVTSTTNVTIE